MKTDAQLEADVAAELRWQAGEHASDIGLTVERGIVALSGVVNTPAQRHAAAEAVERVVGVRAIKNRMMVRARPDKEPARGLTGRNDDGRRPPAGAGASGLR